MTRIGITIAALLVGTAASAQSGLDGVIARLESQGFGRFEIEQDRGRITIEAHRGRDERELVYDARTGSLVRDTIEQGGGRDRPSRQPEADLGGPVAPSAVLERAGLGGVYERLRREGFRGIETEQERGRIKIEARNGRQERELVYDARTGELLRDTLERDDDDDRRDRRDRSRRAAAAGSGSDTTAGNDGGRRGGWDDDDDDDDRGRGRDRGGRGGWDDDDDDDRDRGRGRDRDDDDDDDDDDD